MKEITRIITARITHIEKVADENELVSADRVKSEYGEIAKHLLNADDVVVDNVQDFVRDIVE